MSFRDKKISFCSSMVRRYNDFMNGGTFRLADPSIIASASRQSQHWDRMLTYRQEVKARRAANRAKKTAATKAEAVLAMKGRNSNGDFLK